MNRSETQKSAGAEPSVAQKPAARPSLGKAPAWDLMVVGGGILGLATARALLAVRPRARLLLVEKEAGLALHQSGRNSGVLHSGIYYAPGSLKAGLCVEGRRSLEAYCHQRGVPRRGCGKVIVATRESELGALSELHRRAEANGLVGVEMLDEPGLRAIEPHCAGLRALRVPETSIVDFGAVCGALADDVVGAGGTVRTHARVESVQATPGGLRVTVSPGRTARSAVRVGSGGAAGGDGRGEATAIETRYLINCGGLYSDRIARSCGCRLHVRIVPFRGEYHRLRSGREHLVRGLVYPVPDPGLPFLGVHLTPRIDGAVEVGPNAVLALGREGYRRASVSVRDAAELLLDPALWRLGRRQWRAGLAEARRGLQPGRLLRELQRLVPDLDSGDLVPSRAGVRAQAVGDDGALIDDFHLVAGERSLHVLNAPSPAATASLAIGRHLAERALESFQL